MQDRHSVSYISGVVLVVVAVIVWRMPHNNYRHQLLSHSPLLCSRPSASMIVIWLTTQTRLTKRQLVRQGHSLVNCLKHTTCPAI